MVTPGLNAAQDAMKPALTGGLSSTSGAVVVDAN